MDLVLGTKLALCSMISAEMQHRISCSWNKFYALKKVLLHKDAPLLRRLRAFDTTIGSSLLWCCESWYLRTDERRLLQTARNSMLRRIVGVKRHPDDDWIAWVQRATRRARQFAESAGVRCWLEHYEAAKRKFATKLAHGDMMCWAWHVAVWRDQVWQHVIDETCKRFARRSRPGPWTRWETDLNKEAKRTGHSNWIVYCKALF